MTRIALVFDTDGDVDPEWLKHAQSLTTSHDLLYLLPGGVQVANIFKVPDDGQVGVIGPMKNLGQASEFSTIAEQQYQKDYLPNWPDLTKNAKIHLGVSGSGLANALTGLGLSATVASTGLKKWGDSLTTVPDEAVPPYPEDEDHGLYFHQLKYLPEGTKISDRSYDKPYTFTKDILGWADPVSGKTLSENDFTDEAFWAVVSFPEPFDRTLTQLEGMSEFERVIDAEGDVWEFDGMGNSKVLYSTKTPPGYSSNYEPIGMMGEYGPFAVLSS